eukprot:TRINITY_DN55701_c0_g1_i1.p1 TRINITY_DN55701_c0_g1~~TRINITY_DN55701_c0_g1_i1.p1  ORF type:complete len:396 (-),score=91.92 TRINITY_DN55701_c0_g1_i1:46-1173(-)
MVADSKQPAVLKKHIRELEPYLPPLDGRDAKKFLLLDFNERTMPVPAHVTEAVKAHLDDCGLQSYPAYGELHAQIAKYAGVLPEQCMFTNGSDQGIDLVVRCCCNEGTEAIIPGPTFAMYEQAAKTEGLVIKSPSFTLEKGFPLQEVLAAITPRTSIVVFSNPNNPTGTAIPREAILEVARKAPQVAMLVDECYYEYMPPESSVCDMVAELPNLFVARTFSKTWGIPALRLGYLISSNENIRAMCSVRGPYDINQLAVVAIRAALKDSQYVRDFVDEVNTRAKPKFESYLRDKGIVFWPSSCNFIFCYFERPAELEVALRARGILVRPKKDAKGVLGLRITVGTLEQMNRLMAALDDLLAAQSENGRETKRPRTD